MSIAREEGGRFSNGERFEGKGNRMGVSMLQCAQSEFAAVKKTSRSMTGEQQTGPCHARKYLRDLGSEIWEEMSD